MFEGEEAGVFEEVVGGGVLLALEEPLEFLEVWGPMDAVEELAAGELGFVEGGTGVAGAEVDVVIIGGGKVLDGLGHDVDAEVLVEVGGAVKGEVVVSEAGWFEVEGNVADFLAGIGGEDEEVREEAGSEEFVEAFVTHDPGAETGFGVVFAEFAPFGSEIELGAGDEFDADAGEFAEDAAVFGGGFEGGEIDAEVAGEVEAVEVFGAGKEAGGEELSRSFAGFREGPDDVGKDVVLVVGGGFGEEEFHSRQRRGRRDCQLTRRS